jgi:hypothetical protein
MKRSPEGRSGRSSRRAPNTPRVRRVLLGVIVLLALILRIASYADTPRPLDGAGLAAEQAEIARNIVDHGKWFVANTKALELIKAQQTKEGRLLEPSRVELPRADRHPSYEKKIDQMPGLAIVLAGLWWLTGRESYALVQWLQILIDTGLVLVIYWIASHLTSSTRISMFAAFLYAVWVGSIVVVMRPVLDTWATFFTIGCVGAFVWARERPHNLWRLVPLGVLAGLGIYFRPFVALLPLVLGLIATPEPTLRRRLVWAAFPTVVALLVLSPWTIRNYYEFHRFIPTRTGLGQAVFLGAGGASRDEGAAATVHKTDPNARYGSPKYDDFLVRAAVRQISDNPRYYGSLILYRTRFLLPCLLVVLVWRRWKTAGLILAGTAMTTIVPYLFIGGDTRFYLPAAFAYLILGSMATAVVLSQFRRLIASGGHRDLVAALPHRQVDQWVVSGPSKESS